MKHVFITSTLHNDWNKAFNPKLCAALEAKGITCHLPQRDTDQASGPEAKYTGNHAGIHGAKKMLGIAENESVNWGGEMGYAFGIGKEIIALQKKGHEIPITLRYMVKHLVEVDDLDDIERYIDKLVEKINTYTR